MTHKVSANDPSDKVFTSKDPANGKFIASTAVITAARALDQLRLTARGQKLWAKLEVTERCSLIHPLANQLRNQATDLANLITREMGKPIQQALDEVEKCARTIDYYCENADNFLQPVEIHTGNSKSYTCYNPLGIILGVLPWNFPIWQTIRACIPALIAGNAFAYKHAPNVQLCAAALAKVFNRIEGFPDICVNLPIQIETVPELISSPLVQGVTFTGSSAVGSKIGSWTGAAIKPCLLELGGSDPYIVLADADLELAAKTAATARMHNSGQSCIGAKRIIVVESVAEEFTNRFHHALTSYEASHPSKPDCKLGPLARQNLRKNLHLQVMESIRMGADCLLGGSIPDGPGNYYPATLLINPPKESPASNEELFGPVASLFTVADDASAIELANSSDYGLGAAIFSRDEERAEAIIRDEIRTGFGAVNSQVKSDPRLPFGGVGQSGFGRELGAEGLRAFTNLKTIVVR